ncbi:MAG: hypothetical protein Q8R28_11115, partial [Dehalococcoidia bacterium]|nr:hypothetical protein [Dehalococcoidia bacterium]
VSLPSDYSWSDQDTATGLPTAQLRAGWVRDMRAHLCDPCGDRRIDAITECLENTPLMPSGGLG